jgi:hypothetical protein
MRASLPRRPRHLLAGALLLLGSSVAPAAAEETAPPRRDSWDYEVRVEPDLSRLRVRLCMRGFQPKRLVLEWSDAFRALRFAAPPAGVTLRQDPRTGEADVEGLGDGGCVEYEVDVASMMGAVERLGTRRVGENVIVPSGGFLLRPALVPEGWRGTATFVLPEGVGVAAPWAARSDADPAAGTASGGPVVFDLEESLFTIPGHVALGRFETTTVEAGQATFRVAIFPGEKRATTEGIRRWLGAAASAVAGLYGKFPEPRVRVLVMPDATSDEPVVFGSAWRGGGPALHLRVARNAEDASLPGEWVCVHEMIHLGMPVFDLAAAWFTEGFTTYYQEVLRSRAGMTTPERAWARMEEGFAAGRRSTTDVPLAEASRRMRETHEYRRIYWAGAAIALEVDVALRRQPAGAARSLDDVIRWVHATYRASAKVRTADEVAAGADAWMGRPVFADVMRRRLSVADFPDVSGLRAFLGFSAKPGGGWERRGDAPGAAIAAAIFGSSSAPPEAPAPGR